MIRQAILGILIALFVFLYPIWWLHTWALS